MRSMRMDEYAAIVCNDILLPDDILIRDGVSCGDQLILQGALDDGILSFSFSCNACLQCRAMLGYLHTQYNHRDVDDVLSCMDAELGEAATDFSSFCQRVFGTSGLRRNCILQPMTICRDFFAHLKKSSYQSCPVKKTTEDLDCDACVSTGRILWRNTPSPKAPDIVGTKVSSSDFSYAYRKTWMPLAKASLTAEEVHRLQEIADDITYDDVLRFAKLKIEQMIFFNITRYCPATASRKTIWRNIFYRQYRRIRVKPEIDALRQHIVEQKLHAFFVKGAFTQRFYHPDTGIRLFLDYDILAMSSADAFRIAAFLFRRGFKIFYSEFSIKRIQSESGLDRYAGHFHLQKIICGQYKIIIDVNFPGFPMGRIALYEPRKFHDGEISCEDAFIITLCHLFKHKDVFMKDINDLYFLLASGLDLGYLKEQIKQNHLEMFFSIAAKYIVENYKIPAELQEKIQHSFDLEKVILNGWPYDYDQVYAFKRKDLDQRTVDYEDFERTYLFPLAIFFDALEMTDVLEQKISGSFPMFQKLDGSLYQLREGELSYLICGMGIFWDYANNGRTYKRSDVERFVNRIVDLLGMKDKIVYLPYYLERQGKWFD